MTVEHPEYDAIDPWISSLATTEVVNIASVPHRSPFRYPGGKTWLVPRVQSWLRRKQTKPALFLEPFAGGASIGLMVGAEDLAQHVMLVEMDEGVAAVWHTILVDDNGAAWLSNRITTFEINEEAVQAELASPAIDERDLAWKTILRNRVQRGGILAPGAGLIRTGEKGKGLSSRWYPHTLARRIMGLHLIRSKFTFLKGDGIQAMRDSRGDHNCVTFADPPYTAGKDTKRAGARLYTHSEIDHSTLFELAGSMAGDVLLTYDDNPETRRLAEQFGLQCATVAMKSTHHATMSELVIGRDLSWLGSARQL